MGKLIATVNIDNMLISSGGTIHVSSGRLMASNTPAPIGLTAKPRMFLRVRAKTYLVASET